MDSTNGTRVNGRRIAEVVLHDGDKIQLGDTILKFVMPGELDAPSE